MFSHLSSIVGRSYRGPADSKHKRGGAPAAGLRAEFSSAAVCLTSACLIVFGCASQNAEKLPPQDPQTARSIAQGGLVGFSTQDGAHAWRGIPFATPPVGELRWRAPLAPAKWNGELDARSFGASCVQFANQAGGRDGAGEGEATGSEDCLYLNIYAPKFAAGEVPTDNKQLPVMYWIHGGGNSVGDAVVYDGSQLAVQENVVVVTAHYRLGALGWFSHPSLRAPGTNALDGSGNYGTLDLVRGLEWVRDNIAAFGGDAGRVTVFGESAGGSNVFSVLLSPQANGLFHGAIAESGSAQTVSRSAAENFVDAPEPGEATSFSEVIAMHLIADGLAGDRDEAKSKLAEMGDEEVARYLRGLSRDQVLRVYDGSAVGGMYRSPELIQDGVVLPAMPAVEAFAKGHYNQVPSILGTNRDENRLFNLFGSKHVTKLFGFPIWFKDVDRFQAEAGHPARMWKVKGLDAPAAAMREVQGDTVFGYRFDWDEQPKVLFMDMSQALGAAHAIEIPFVFGWLSLGPATRFVFDEDKAESNRQLSDSIMSYWSEFAYTGNPGRGRDGDQPLWRSWSDASNNENKFILLDSMAGGGIRMAPDDTLTREAVIAGVATDPRLTDYKRDRCSIYYNFNLWGGGMTAEEYESIEAGSCAAEYPMADYPW